MAEAEIRDVWDHNLEEEMNIIRNLVHEYPYVAMVYIYIIFIHHLFFNIYFLGY